MSAGNTDVAWLTATVAEDIQHAAEKGIRLAPIVANLRSATLPGMVEYICLRGAMPSAIPQLPRAILSSPIGKALGTVQCESFGEAPARRPESPRGIGTQSVEFWILDGQEQFARQDWQQFEVRFNRSAQSVGVPRKVAFALQGALHEMVENAVIHAHAPIPTLVAYHVAEGMAQFCVADLGIGVLASLRQCDDYRHLALHNQAIREALRDGTSRFGRNTRGLGFRSVFKALMANWGRLRFRSGNGCITMDGTDLNADRGQESFPPSLPGFQVALCCQAGDRPLLEPVM